MKIVIYKTLLSTQRGYRWRLVAANGKTVAHGGQGYSRRHDLMHAITIALGGGIAGNGTFLRRHFERIDIPIVDRTKR